MQGSGVLRGLVAGREVTPPFSGCRWEVSPCALGLKPVHYSPGLNEAPAATLGAAEGAFAHRWGGAGPGSCQTHLGEVTALLFFADSRPGRNPTVSSPSLVSTPALCP